MRPVRSHLDRWGLRRGEGCNALTEEMWNLHTHCDVVCFDVVCFDVNPLMVMVAECQHHAYRPMPTYGVKSMAECMVMMASYEVTVEVEGCMVVFDLVIDNLRVAVAD